MMRLPVGLCRGKSARVCIERGLMRDTRSAPVTGSGPFTGLASITGSGIQARICHGKSLQTSPYGDAIPGRGRFPRAGGLRRLFAVGEGVLGEGVMLGEADRAGQLAGGDVRRVA